LYESTGDLKRAEMHYLIALEERPGYAYALAGLGHLAATAGAYPKALQYYQQADSAVQDYALKEQIGQLYLLMGEKKKGEAIIQKMISDMNAEAGNGKDDGTVGHYSDRELAYAWLLVGNGDKALLHAKAEYERRPLNIDVNETLAWVYYKTGAIQKALPFINAALKTHSVNPVLLNRAGLIYAAAGDKVRAKELLILGTRNQPSIDVSLLQEARAVLKNL
jgi:tetratricopeptide (TPR) repeat protein